MCEKTRVQEAYHVWLYPSWVFSLKVSFKMMLPTAWISWFPQKAWKPASPRSHEPLWTPPLTTAQRERQRPSNCHFPAGCQTITYIFFPPEKPEETGSLKWNVYTTPTTHLSDCSVYRSKHDFCANRFYQVREMKSNRLFFSCLIHYHPQEF